MDNLFELITFQNIFYIAAFLSILFILFKCFVIVGGNEMCIIERKYIGKQMESGGIIAKRGELGIQAKTLGPGSFSFLIPFVFNARKSELTEIETNEIGILESIDGIPLGMGKIFAYNIDGHNSFQDAETFLRNGGQKGTQVSYLPPGKWNINTELFNIDIVPIISVPDNHIGIVTSQDGEPLSESRLLGKRVSGHNNFQDGAAFLREGGQKGPQLDILRPGSYRINTKLFQITMVPAQVIPSGSVGIIDALDGQVLPQNEFVASHVEGHDNFQDADAFLTNKGQRGPQLDTLRPGVYYINPLMFKVKAEKALEVQRGQVAVLVSNIGKEPEENSEIPVTQRKERYVVPNGFRGIREEVLGPGKYYLNPAAFTPLIVSTVNQTIDWDDGKEAIADEAFNPLNVVSKDGFSIKVGVKVVIRVRPDQAPQMVAKIGDIDSLISNVIHPLIDSSFRNQASEASAMEFMQDRGLQQKKAESHVRDELEKYHVDCINVLICQISLDEELMKTQTKKIIAEQEVNQYAAEQKAQESRAEAEKMRATADNQGLVVAAEIAVKVADQKKLETITIAQGQAESTKLIGEGEAKKITSIGEAQAQAYQKQKDAIGSQAITAIEIVKEIAKGNIKLVPDILSMGGSSEANLSNVLTKLFAGKLLGDGISDKIKSV